MVGIPVIEVGIAFQSAGLKYYGCRNEQAASYAAGAVGYLTQRPGVCLVVSGPGVIHALAGLANAKENCWPMLLLGGANDSLQDGMMAFQEEDQLRAVRQYCKFAARPPTIDQFPFFLDRAIRIAVSGRPGPVYLDLPGDMVNSAPSAAAEDAQLPSFYPTPVSMADPRELERAVQLLKGACVRAGSLVGWLVRLCVWTLTHHTFDWLAGWLAGRAAAAARKGAWPHK